MIGLALGLPTMGKTQALQDYVGAHALQNRFFVVDRTEDWGRESHRWRGIRWKEWTSVIARVARFADISTLPLTTDHPWYADAPGPDEDLEVWLERLPATGVFRFPWPWEGIDVAQLAVDVGNCTFVDDEIDFTALNEGWKQNPLREVCHRGRHLPNLHGVMGQVHILGAARRAQNMAVDLTTLADFVWVFRLRGHRTLERLVHDSLLLPEELDAVRALPRTHFRFWTVDGETSWGQLTPYAHKDPTPPKRERELAPPSSGKQTKKKRPADPVEYEEDE